MRRSKLSLKGAIAAGTLAMLSTGLLTACGGDKKTTPTVGSRTPILSRIESGASVDPSLAGVSVVLPPAQINAEWAQVGGSASKSYGHLALTENPSKIWTKTIAGSSSSERLAASPVIGSGKLFVQDTKGVIYAFDKATGAQVWKVEDTEMADDMRPSAFGGGVSYDNGIVYATNGAGDVKAMRAETGEVIWKVHPAGPLRGSPTIAFGQLTAMRMAARFGPMLWRGPISPPK